MGRGVLWIDLAMGLLEGTTSGFLFKLKCLSNVNFRVYEFKSTNTFKSLIFVVGQKAGLLLGNLPVISASDKR